MRTSGHFKTMTLLTAAALAAAATGCSTVRSIFGADSQSEDSKPIHNPFGEYYSGAPNEASRDPIILRSRQGDRAVELQMPNAGRNDGDIVLPIPPGGAKALSAEDPSRIDSTYGNHKPTAADREIASALPHGDPAQDSERTQVEQQLGLRPTDSGFPEHDQSYLAGVDKLKQLFRAGRYEAAIIQTDDMIGSYPTDPMLYKMRGTLLDRLGRTELALKSWKQALRFAPDDLGLKKYLDRKEKKLRAYPETDSATREGEP